LRSAQRAITLQLYCDALVEWEEDQPSHPVAMFYVTHSYFASDGNFVGLLQRPDAASMCGFHRPDRGPTSTSPACRAARRARRSSPPGSAFRTQPTALDAKALVVDGEWSTIGSMNFDNRSMALNTKQH
jgi:hypothetical protein